MIAVIWSIENAVRVTIALAAVGLVGANIAFVLHAPIIFPRGATMVWRLFFAGKSMITLSAAWAVWTRTAHNRPLTLYSLLVVAGVAFSNTALFMLWRFHMKHNKAVIVIPGDHQEVK